MNPPSFPLVCVVDASWQMSLLIGLLLCARPWLRRFAGSRAVACLWLLVAARLMMPWPLAARWSLPAPWPASAARAPRDAFASPPSLTIHTWVGTASGGPREREG